MIDFTMIAVTVLFGILTVANFIALGIEMFAASPVSSNEVPISMGGTTGSGSQLRNTSTMRCSNSGTQAGGERLCGS